MENGASEIPLCTSCGHRHVQGVKCHICGHVGRSQIYQKMKIRSDEKRSLKVLFFNGPSFSESLDDWDVIMELRKAIYCTEFLIPMELEFDEAQEKSSRHLICYVGDAPVATARYRVFTAPDNASYTEIDRLGILPHYRGRKLSRKVMLEILSDSQEVSRSPISVVLLSIPVESWIQSKLESIGWSVNHMSSMEQRGPRLFFQMIFHATPS